jgi:hypothetical protein
MSLLQRLTPKMLRQAPASAIAMGALLTATPCLATPSPTAPAEPLQVANIFNIIREASQILETINTVDSLIDQLTGGRNQTPQQPEPAASPTPAAPVATPPAPRAATSQSPSTAQVLHRNDSPGHCQMGDARSSDGNCEAFQMTQSGGVLVFSYYFKGVPISFIASAEPLQQTESAAGYAVGKLMVDDTSTDMLGSCVVGRVGNQYQQVLCRTEGGLEFMYRNL